MTELEQNHFPAAPAGGGRNKPVVVYIMVLFIAAFLLMALSFLIHQRSNTETLGVLQSSMSALQDLQESQSRIEELERALEEARAAAADLQNAGEAARNQAAALEDKLSRTVTAMSWFCQLNEAYALGDAERCRTILQRMEEGAPSPLYEQLPREAGGVEGPVPYDRYLEIRSALTEQ